MSRYSVDLDPADRFVLTAELGRRRKTVEIWEPEDGTGRLDRESRAVIGAIARVLRLAYRDDLWAKGRITLTGPDGTVLHTMDAK